MKSLMRTEPEELIKFWSAVNQHPVIEARKLFPRRPCGYVRATKDLANFASNRVAYLFCKEQGDKVGMKIYQLIYDRIADGLYRSGGPSVPREWIA